MSNGRQNPSGFESRGCAGTQIEEPMRNEKTLDGRYTDGGVAGFTAAAAFSTAS